MSPTRSTPSAIACPPCGIRWRSTFPPLPASTGWRGSPGRAAPPICSPAPNRPARPAAPSCSSPTSPASARRTTTRRSAAPSCASTTTPAPNAWRKPCSKASPSRWRMACA
ncbi:hypothetical protein WR25_19600 [Diploscapter pachys]|uniref:Uncharacterized protein n=1 Tax=Diploscapter pachys TaxID=2018661 RepID=A0A2A2M4X1_9BILA|nr:hypothetical protein WR25_19600 [Diploscapter pachys]